MTPLIPYDFVPYPHPWDQLKYQFPFIKVVKWANGERTELFIENEFYWQSMNGHTCPTCHQFVFGSSHKKE